MSLTDPQGRPIENERVYRVAVTSFIASGGDGCDAWKKGKKISETVSGETVFTLVLQELDRRREAEKEGVNGPEVEGRVVDVGA